MASLHIEHPITDLATWSRAYATFSEVRRAAGVSRESVRQPVDDPCYIVVDLEFETSDLARDFLAFLEANVWPSPERSPALAGTPDAKILEDVEITAVL